MTINEHCLLHRVVKTVSNRPLQIRQRALHIEDDSRVPLTILFPYFKVVVCHAFNFSIKAMALEIQPFSLNSSFDALAGNSFDFAARSDETLAVELCQKLA